MSENKNVKTRQVVTAHPSSLKASNINIENNNGFWAKIIRNSPVLLSATLSFLWVGFCTYFASNAGFLISSLSITELSMALSGVLMPLVLIWIFCLIAIRINPLEDSYRALGNGLDQLLSPVEITQERILKVIENLKTEISNIEFASDVAASRFKTLEEGFKKQAEELSRITDKSISELEKSGKAIEFQTQLMEESIESATAKSKVNIAKASDYFAEVANDVNKNSSELEANIKQNLDEITSTITNKTSSLSEDISVRFQNIEADIDRGNVRIDDLLITNIDALNKLINSNKNNTEKLLGEIRTSIEKQSSHIEKSLNDTRINMIDKTTLIQEEYQSLEDYAENFQHKMGQTELEFKKQHKNMLSCISTIEGGLSVAVEKIKKNSTSLGTQGQKVIESIIGQTADLTNQIAEIQNRSRNSLIEIQNASLKAEENILGKEKQTTEIISEWLKAVKHVSIEHSEGMRNIEKLIADLTSIDRNATKTIASSEENIRRISNELLRSSDRIHLASNSAVEAMEETNNVLDQNAEKYQQMINAIQLSSQSLATNANAIESRLKKINSEKFSHISAKTIEKLQSTSIDINKFLEGDIPKSLWDNYISGDKNVFIRKFKKHIGKSALSDIREKYRDDRDFRQNVDSFVQTFEELLATFTETTETVYTETLITSDLGKVYFALAEASGRLNT